MKGNEKVIAELNARLKEELTAINQYTVHAEINENWGYMKLHGVIWKRTITEMKHAEKLIARIIFLEGMPVVSTLNEIHIGPDVPKQFANDTAAEYDAVAKYNGSIKLCVELGDAGTKELLETILKDEESHVDALEAFGDQIKQMGLQNFLALQM